MERPWTRWGVSLITSWHFMTTSIMGTTSRNTARVLGKKRELLVNSVITLPIGQAIRMLEYLNSFCPLVHEDQLIAEENDQLCAVCGVVSVPAEGSLGVERRKEAFSFAFVTLDLISPLRTSKSSRKKLSRIFCVALRGETRLRKQLESTMVKKRKKPIHFVVSTEKVGG